MTDRTVSVPAAQVPESQRPVPSSPVSRPSGPQPTPFTAQTRTWLEHIGTLKVTNILLAILIVLGALLLSHQTTYKYMTVTPNDITFDQQMSAYGAKGWKTESCRRASDSSDYSPTYNYECVMSRARGAW